MHQIHCLDVMRQGAFDDYFGEKTIKHDYMCKLHLKPHIKSKSLQIHHRLGSSSTLLRYHAPKHQMPRISRYAYSKLDGGT
jgi:hypothetical protein